MSRISLTKKEVDKIWQLLTSWAIDNKESKIVRVNSIQGLFSLANEHQELKQDLELMVTEIKKEKVPSINARLKKLENASH